MYLQKSAMLDCISVTAVGPATYLHVLGSLGVSEEVGIYYGVLGLGFRALGL